MIPAYADSSGTFILQVRDRHTGQLLTTASAMQLRPGHAVTIEIVRGSETKPDREPPPEAAPTRPRDNHLLRKMRGPEPRPKPKARKAKVGA